MASTGSTKRITPDFNCEQLPLPGCYGITPEPKKNSDVALSMNDK
jgi:hypothetical protein